jgi:hypothetical protein
MFDLRAAYRLRDSEFRSTTQAAHAEAKAPLEAAFDQQRDPELQKIEQQLRKVNVFFTLSKNHLYHKSNRGDVVREAETCSEVLNDLGYQLHIQPNIFERSSFALKGVKGIVLQKLNNDLRIFFSV